MPEKEAAVVDEVPASPRVERQNIKWYRSTFYNALILGLANFSAPGLWGAMNSLGAAGQAKPYLVNAANAMSFCLMVVSCYFSSALVRLIGIKWALIIGTMGYPPYAAGMYTNNRFGNEWFVLVGAALCGISAGIFWMAEAAIALAYPEPYNQGKFLGFWLSFRLSGQILGGAINIGINAHKAEAGKVSYSVYLIFIALQALGPFIAFLLNHPSQVQRSDGKKVDLYIVNHPWSEIKATTKLFFTKNFLLIVPFIGQAVYTEAVMFTFSSLWFSVRARALGSFLSGIVAITAGNLLGHYLDRARVSLRLRARTSFFIINILQLGLWIWSTILVTRYRRTHPTYDWADGTHGFAAGFTLFLLLVLGFQLNYMYLYFVIGQLTTSPAETVRLAALLRGTESAWQAVSYGLNAVKLFAEVGGFYLNFALWAIALLPAWLVVGKIGTQKQDQERRVSTGVFGVPVEATTPTRTSTSADVPLENNRESGGEAVKA
ncbi:Notoamide biosynthesis cluster protein O' [Exophiala dermatitidis]